MIPTAKLLDFTRNGDHYTFRIGAKDDHFYQALTVFKWAIPLADRWFDPELKLWTVKCTEANQEALRAIFTNGAAVITMVEAQLTLF